MLGTIKDPQTPVFAANENGANQVSDPTGTSASEWSFSRMRKN